MIGPLLLVAAAVGGLLLLKGGGGGPTRLEPFPALPGFATLGLSKAMRAIPNGGAGSSSEKIDSVGNRWLVALFPSVGPDLVATAATLLASKSGNIKLDNDTAISVAFVQNAKTGERQELAVFSGTEEEPNDVRKIWGLKLV